MVTLFFIAFPVFLVIDLAWLGFVARHFYKDQLGALMSPKPNWVAAIIFYLLFVAGLVFFVIQPSVEKADIAHALLTGAFFGLVTYATYDLTNLATLRNWPLKMTLVDLLWGTVLGALVAVITTWIGLR